MTKPDDQDKEKDNKDEPVIVKIDIDGMGQRILSLRFPGKNYFGMQAGKTGILVLRKGPMVLTEEDFPNVPQTIQKFDLSSEGRQSHQEVKTLQSDWTERRFSTKQRRVLGDCFLQMILRVEAAGVLPNPVLVLET